METCWSFIERLGVAFVSGLLGAVTVMVIRNKMDAKKGVGE